MRTLVRVLCLACAVIEAASPIAAAEAHRSRPGQIADDDGQWWAFGDHQTGQGLPGTVLALASFDGRVVAGGTFYWLPGASAGEYIDGGYLGAWDGSRWHSLNGGFNNDFFPGAGSSDVQSLATFRGDLIAGGRFNFANGFTRNRVNNIARWDGMRWQSMGGGMTRDPGYEDPPLVRTLVEYKGDLIASGRFEYAGGRAARNIARWDGTQWHPLGGGLLSIAQEMVVHGNDLIVVGTWIDSPTGANIARWDGSTWSTIGEQTVFSGSATVFRDTLIANVIHTYTDGITYPFVSRWTNSRWEPLGGGLVARLGSIAAFAVVDGQLYAGGGGFWSSNPFDFIARWTGSAFVGLGAGIGGGDEGHFGNVLALLAHGGSLYVGGSLSRAAGQPSYAIARWDPKTTPIAVAGFSAAHTEAGVVLEWTLSAGAMRALRAVHVERAGDRAGPFVTISAELAPAPRMQSMDPHPPERTPAWYRLRLLAATGEFSSVGPIEVARPEAAGPVHLYPPIQTAGSPGATIRFSAGSGTSYTVALYTTSGRLLRVLDRGIGNGERRFVWDGADAAGRRVARGVYLVHLRTGQGARTEKLVLVAR